MTETEGQKPLQLALEKAQKIKAEIQNGKISEESQPIIEKFEKIYQFEQQQYFNNQELEEKQQIEQFLKNTFGNFGGFVYTNWKNKNHPESENTSPYGDKSVDTVKNPSIIGKNKY